MSIELIVRPFHAEIDQIYKDILFRPVDDSGYETYSGLLASQEINLQDLANILRESAEFANMQRSTERARRYRDKLGELVQASQIHFSRSRISSILDPAPESYRPGYLFVNSTPRIHFIMPLDTGAIIEGPQPLSINFERIRNATASDIAWLSNDVFVVALLEDSTTRTYRCDFIQGCVERLDLSRDGMNWPETLDTNREHTEIVIAQAGDGSVTRHQIESNTFCIMPPVARRELGVPHGQLHGISYSPDERFLICTTIDEPGFIRVLDIKTLEDVYRYANPFAPLKPKSVAFSDCGSRMTVVFSPNAGRAAAQNGLLVAYKYCIEDGTFDSDPIDVLIDDGNYMDVPDVARTLPAGNQIIYSNQGNDTVALIDRSGPNPGILRTFVKTGLELPHGVRVSDDNKWLGVTNFGDCSISVFAISALHIAIICLTRANDRINHVAEHLLPGLELMGASNPVLIEAIDGRAQSMVDHLLNIGFSDEKLQNVSEFMKNKLACALSHDKAWCYFDDDAPLLLLEDDAVLMNNALDFVSEAINTANRDDPNWDLIHFFSNCESRLDVNSTLVLINDDLRRHHGNVGYAVSATGRRKLRALTTERILGLSAECLQMTPQNPHFALDRSIVDWAEKDELRVFWSTRQVVETVGQFGQDHSGRDLKSTLFPD